MRGRGGGGGGGEVPPEMVSEFWRFTTEAIKCYASFHIEESKA